MGSIPGSGRSPGERNSRPLQQPTPVFLPEKPHGQTSLVGYSSKGCKGSDTTERLSIHSSMVPGIDPKADKKTVGLNQNLYLGYIHLPTHHPRFSGWASVPGSSDDKEYACNAVDPGSILGREDPLKKGMASHSIILAWRIPWTEEPSGLQSMGSQKSWM